MILAIDPGNEKSAFVLLSKSINGGIVDKGIWKNEDLLPYIQSAYHKELVVEMVASYGMAVGRTVFETCVWIGRFIQANKDGNKKDIPHHLVYRKDIKMHLCQSMRAKDSNIMQTLKDRYGEVGTKKNPGPLYGVSKDIWSALAVATYYQDTRIGK